MNPSQTFDLIAVCAFGLEAVVRRELTALGIESTIGESGRVHFQGDMETVAKTNLWLRCADRVTIRVAEFPAADFDALFETTKALPWGDWLPADAEFPVTGRSVKSTLTSVPACQRAIKRAIVDAMRRDHQTESLPETGPQFKIDVALLKDTATITIDSTGRGLHRRGYRSNVTAAPLKETLAAAMVMLSYWKRDRPLVDPFCGSGTILIEAAMIGRNMAPGQSRDFAFEQWPDSPRETLLQLRTEALQNVLEPLPQRLLGSDTDFRVLRFARENAEAAGVTADVHFETADVRDLKSSRRFGCMITNPPYGMRLGRDWEIEELYAAIPHVLRHLPTWSFYFLTSFGAFEKVLGRQADRRRKLYNGRIECTYYQFQGPKPVLGESGRTATPTEETAPPEQLDAPASDVEPVSAKSPWAGKVASQEVESKPEPPRTAKPYVHAVGTAAFGALPENAQHQADLFATRLRKRAKHFRRMMTRRNITCYRLYERDIPEIPLVVDRYENHLHLSEFERPHDRDAASHASWLDLMAATAGEALDVPKENVFLKRRSRQRGKTQHEKVAATDRKFPVQEGGLTFLVNLADYIDTGLFLDHRVTRQMVRDQAAGKHFLNLFAYTGSFTTYAAAGGAASTTSVDLSQNYLDWAQENLQANGLDGPQHQFAAMDISEFIRRHKPGEVYDLVVCDPPTFSNSKRTDEDWNVQTDAVPLLNNVLKLVRPGGVIYFSTNFRRFKFDSAALAASAVHEISKQTVPDEYRNRRIHRCWKILK
ncbi:bifunctional 23S rRNA (guanine(2069)-N(7))-methyltransferase RlmK/23S rRNA (guanine(2445)-N(2))-methyltransferase RlmL [Aporhodopirellula aestuarii]|uniref:Bifunctional 23S rRNA (Guanine(2069)-N(7))-methyltransferase RlmK/23S rRNA (Guanine(2445)-N(2))-methyltransferase RlmL n=1 Tax=Aporhodopirellula aestuarii TaxID=2950107 RepID=A0ABT0U437_9BACT|nr:bifunctional 23S rRNA (guanine(2069)-N(7))-methyltransferase RlmK/23S rRNA (guanine(2445)-N(2))-methyltransferase RlmL [Aporhodopirellula aestuarii]MCM2371689.1 bifunctional 23S rRNA (guanine(2069)-N(7))-methyltransferase RlmK/23S rRNA (guanine(2445)-N(2))-methyltransferase RlmL [Aporhodopirellula aestuarii]